MSAKSSASGEFIRLSETAESVTEFALPTRWARLRKHLYVCLFRLRNWAGQGSPFERILYTLAFLYLPVVSAIKMGWSTWTIGGFIVFLIALGTKAYRDSSPKHMQQLAKGYLTRKIMLNRLIQDLSSAHHLMGAHEISRFQQEALSLIAAYVRDHRRDESSKVIFANLLVGDGNDLVVVARDRTHRVIGARYPKTQMVAARALDTGKPQIVGELYSEWPETVGDRTYRSILAIPVFLRERIVGVVSIDSSRPWHFHADPNLVDYLMPYVGLLAWTLDSRYASKRQEPTGENR